MKKIEIPPQEARDLLQVCQDSANVGNLGSAKRAWETIQKTFSCELDTDGDKNCHVCFNRGGCPLNQRLERRVTSELSDQTELPEMVLHFDPFNCGCEEQYARVVEGVGIKYRVVDKE